MSVSGIAIFSEDVRAEKAGTDTIVGVFPDNLSFPTEQRLAMAKMVIYARIQVSLDWKPSAIALNLYTNDTESELTVLTSEFIGTSQKEAKDAGAPFATIISRATFAPFPIVVPSRFTVAIVNAEGRQDIGYLNVHKGDEEPN